MKKITVVAILAFLIFSGGTLSAQSEYFNFSPSVADSWLIINAGIGFGPLEASGYKRGIPPLSVSAAFKLPIDLPITVGPIVGLTSQKFSFNAIVPEVNPTTLVVVNTTYGYEFTYTQFAVGARGMYHFNFLEKMDVYGGLTLGYVFADTNAKYTGNWSGTIPQPANISYVLWGLNVGARYFFTDSLGAYAELGYSGLQFFSLGVAVKIQSSRNVPDA